MADRLRLTASQVAGLRTIMDRHADEDGWVKSTFAINRAGLFETGGLKVTVYEGEAWPDAGYPEARYELDGKWPDYAPLEIPLTRRERLRRRRWGRRHGMTEEDLAS